MREAALVSEAVFWDVTSKNDVHVVICLFCESYDLIGA